MAALAAAALATGSAAPAHAQTTGGWITCEESAVGQATPGLTGVPKPASFVMNDVMTNCRSSDPTIGGATAVVRANSAAVSCAGGPIEGIADIEWDNGETTTLIFSGAVVAGIATARGSVIGGTRFVGQHFAAADQLSFDEHGPSPCLTDEGLETFFVEGRILIGVPGPDALQAP